MGEKIREMLRRKETEKFVAQLGTNVVHADFHDNQPLGWYWRNIMLKNVFKPAEKL